MGDDKTPAETENESGAAPRVGGGSSGFGAFKKKGAFGRGNVRKRMSQHEEEDDDMPASTTVVPAEKKKKTLALGGSTARDDKEKLRVFTFEGDRGVQQRGDGGATAELQIDTEKHMDGRAAREKVLQTAAERAEGFEDDKKYRGMNNYIDYRAGFRKEHSIASEKGGGSHGPMRASANVRLTFIMDYKPDICKDYKETGYCGYGDGCKFMHDRGDYKQGWQLDKEWDLKEKLKKEAQAKLEKMETGLGDDGQELDIDEKEAEDDGLPPACAICENTWENTKDPVVTRCKHYFCEHCALRHNAKDKLCFVCQRPTGGTFNSAKEITKRIKEVKESGGKWGKKVRKDKRDAEYGKVGAQGWLLG